MSALLKVENIGKRFGGVVALDGVSFEVGAAEIVAVIGENGAGKSTLMKILGGVLVPDSGHLEIEGKTVAFHNVSDSMSHGIGFVHQELNVLDNLDVAANVYLGREPLIGGVLKPLKLIDRAQMRAQTSKYLQQLGLTITPDTSLGTLSIAEQQMIEIAKALSLNARLVIMDEPTSSLTLQETDRLLQVTRDLRAQGVSVIYISHRLGEITQIADRVVVLRDGKYVGQLPREEINHNNMVRLMVGRDLERTVRTASESGERVFQVKDVRTRRYPSQSVSFDVHKGEIFGIAGLVGAGRSEMAEAIFGVTPALSGTVQVGDSSAVAAKTARDAIARGIYLVPEDRRKTGLILEWPIRDNIALPNSALGKGAFQLINRQRETNIAEEQRQTLLIKTPSVENRAGNLSGGNQQKVVLAKWLALQPKVMLFDEPTRGIDVGAKGEIYKLMRALADSGVAVVMISSDMEEVLSHSDRIGVMCEGAMTGILTTEQASEEAIMHLAVARSHEVVAPTVGASEAISL